jgi:rubredoxin
MSLAACPSCGFNTKMNILSGSYFWVHKCKQCGHLFCYKCRGSNGARKCPKCDSTSFQNYEKVHLRD